MKRQNVHSAIGALTTLFYVHQDTYLGIATMEAYVEMGLLNDASLIAEIFEETRSCDLLHVIKLFDMKAAEQIEDILRGATT
ncbi:hypothetical protein bcere0016_40610 [Bacillus cereus 95/8201]|uniref:hypothetical protein n=1 Tax=Bacillus cereus group TaxID=86661 RepID=UPI0001A08CAC|nr:hypothetical protein [Bacillus cereus]AJH63784.1 hypothetical protein BG11_4981 [Bacillus cereus]AJK36218.1 hypothetical protein BF33_109 [Bacillus cereus]EEL15554.1 hypothetical protein bcere0016_40610 [Bacillus cereus 95/8201]KWU59061.1 hypothetical protein AWW71_16475 [Bacillus cereus]KWW53260.1 hypothetical protein AWW69_02170 [Bacillus cereus]